MALVRNGRDLDAMREGGKILATVLEYLSGRVDAGMTTKNLADEAGRELKKLGGTPTTLGYKGFPDVICISVNDEVVHGIPGGQVINDGDLVSLDFVVTYKGMVTDAATTVIVGEGTGQKRRLLKATKESLDIGIDRVKSGVHIGDVSSAIEARLRRDNLGVVEDLVGHGVGYEMHEPPEIPNFGIAGRGEILKAEMTIAIEPMATLGGKEVFVDTDGWTVKTRDHSLSAHFEHTVLVTESGAEVLTQL